MRRLNPSDVDLLEKHSLTGSYESPSEIVISPEELKAGGLFQNNKAHALEIILRQGFVILHNAFDPNFIQEVDRAYQDQLQQFISKNGGLEGLEKRTFGKNHLSIFPSITPPIADSQIVAHPIAVQLSEILLGKDLHSSFIHANTAMPGSASQAIHRDGPLEFDALGNPAWCLAINIPLCNFTELNGSTEVWPGTQYVTELPTESHLPASAIEGYSSIRTNMPVGSMIIRDLRTLHRGVPNNSDDPRTMLALVYEPNELSTQPPVTIPSSTWEGWSEEARRIFRKNIIVEDRLHTPRSWW